MLHRAMAVAAIGGVAMAAWALSGCSSDQSTGPAEPETVSLPELFGNQLYRADGSEASVGVLEGIPVIGIFFASPSCPACGAFTPILADAYAQLQEAGQSFEVVLVTGGISESYLFQYMSDAEMPWLALLPGSREVLGLIQRYNVRWVPTLVVIDGDGNTISTTGRDELTQYGPAIYDTWLAASVGE